MKWLESIISLLAILLNGVGEPVDLVLLTHRAMLQSVGSVHVNLTLLVASKDDWSLRSLDQEPDDGSGSVIRLASRVLVEMSVGGRQRILGYLPNLNPTVVSHRSETTGRDRRPLDVIDLVLQRIVASDLLTSQNVRIGLLSCIPEPDSPIVRASHEDLVFLCPEWAAPDSVDRTHVTVVVLNVLVGVRDGASVETGVLSGREVVDSLFGEWEVYGHASCLDESHLALLVFLLSIG